MPSLWAIRGRRLQPPAMPTVPACLLLLLGIRRVRHKPLGASGGASRCQQPNLAQVPPSPGSLPSPCPPPPYQQALGWGWTLATASSMGSSTWTLVRATAEARAAAL